MAKNILVCDDAAFMRMMIKDILTKMVIMWQERLRMALRRLKSTMN